MVRIAGGLAHDFNNILVSILSAASMLQDELPKDRSLQDLVSMITGGAERIANLTGKLLTYSRTGPLRRVQLDVNEVARDAVAMTQSSMEHAKLELSLRASRPLRADRSQLHQLLVNLLVNSAEAVSEETQGTIGLSTEDVPGAVRVEVWDDGVGMDSDTRQKMFEPFFTTKFPGRGLGLAAVGGVIRSHGAQSDVETTPGRGTRIRIDFQADDTPRVASGNEVLVVDEDPMVRRVVCRLLRREGWTAHDAAREVEAKEHLEHHPRIGCVLMDRSTSERRAPDLARWLRRVHPTLPVVVCSAYPKAQALSGLEDEPFGFLPKPFKTEELLRLVRRALESA